jgi:DNA mismatch repair protein MSH2
LVLDHTAANCIHLLPPANAGVATVVGGTVHNNSLWGVLSKPCLTQMGKQKLQVWLRQPLIDLAKILERQDAITDLLGLGKDSIREALKTFGGVDLVQLANTLSQYSPSSDDEDGNNTANSNNTKKPLQALYQLYLLSSSKLPQLLEATQSLENPTSPLLQDAQVQLSKLVGELERCQGLVEAVLDLDQAPREYLVKPSFSPELQDLYQELQQIQQLVDEEWQAMQEVWSDTSGSNSGGQVKLERLNDDSSWQFRLPNTNDTKTLQTLGSKIQVHRLLKNGVYFSTKELRQLSAKYQDFVGDYSRQSKQVVLDAMGVATTYQTVVERASQVVSTLDVLCALAHVAAYSPHGYCKPTLTDSEDDGMGITVGCWRMHTRWRNGLLHTGMSLLF